MKYFSPSTNYGHRQGRYTLTLWPYLCPSHSYFPIDLQVYTLIPYAFNFVNDAPSLGRLLTESENWGPFSLKVRIEAHSHWRGQWDPASEKGYPLNCNLLSPEPMQFRARFKSSNSEPDESDRTKWLESADQLGGVYIHSLPSTIKFLRLCTLSCRLQSFIQQQRLLSHHPS